MKVAPDDPSRPDVVAVLEAHLAFARSTSPPADVHALDVSALLEPSVSFFSLREDGAVLAVGALKDLGDGHLELKSMHTAAAARGKGCARLVLKHLLAEARARGASRVSLETGTSPSFAPARALYESEGFTECDPFASYVDSPHSTFMTCRLA